MARALLEARRQPLPLDGTPFKALTWRLMGVRIGRRVFDDGCAVVDKPLVAIGDDCALNAGSVIQSHSQEDGAFKSDRIEIGAGCTVGTRALVHYGTTMGDGSTLGPDAFLIKGEEVPAGAHWAGNPAASRTSSAKRSRSRRTFARRKAGPALNVKIDPYADDVLRGWPGRAPAGQRSRAGRSTRDPVCGAAGDGVR